MLEQDPVHIGCVLDVQGRQLSVKGLLDTGAMITVKPSSTWTDMGFDRSELIPLTSDRQRLIRVQYT